MEGSERHQTALWREEQSQEAGNPPERAPSDEPPECEPSEKRPLKQETEKQRAAEEVEEEPLDLREACRKAEVESTKQPMSVQKRKTPG